MKTISLATLAGVCLTAFLLIRPVHAAEADVYYRNCAEARAAGAAPIREGEPGYRTGLDRDHDSIACE